jgi:hypothetical protein
MNTKEIAEIWKVYLDKLVYIEEASELIQLVNKEIN